MQFQILCMCENRLQLYNIWWEKYLQTFDVSGNSTVKTGLLEDGADERRNALNSIIGHKIKQQTLESQNTTVFYIYIANDGNT